MQSVGFLARAASGVARLLLGAALAAPVHAAAISQTVVLTASDFPPYSSPDLPQQGIVGAITCAAFERAGYRVVIRYRPWARALKEAEQGISNGIVAVWYTKERAALLAFSKPLLINQIGFYARSGEHIDVHDLALLRHRTIGTVQDYATPKAFAQAHLNTDPSTDDESNLRKLAAGRFDLALVDRGLANWLLNDKLLMLKNKIDWLEPGVDSMPLYLGFSRKSPGWEKRLADFNSGLEAMRRDGSLARFTRRLGY